MSTNWLFESSLHMIGETTKSLLICECMKLTAFIFASQCVKGKMVILMLL